MSCRLSEATLSIQAIELVLQLAVARLVGFIVGGGMAGGQPGDLPRRPEGGGTHCGRL